MSWWRNLLGIAKPKKQQPDGGTHIAVDRGVYHCQHCGKELRIPATVRMAAGANIRCSQCREYTSIDFAKVAARNTSASNAPSAGVMSPAQVESTAVRLIDQCLQLAMTAGPTPEKKKALEKIAANLDTLLQMNADLHIRQLDGFDRVVSMMRSDIATGGDADIDRWLDTMRTAMPILKRDAR